MPEVRGKFKVTEIKRSAWNPDAAEIKLAAQYSSSPEDQTYAQATPTAEITMYVTNPSAVEKMVLGRDFYVDFTPVE